jgi:hypothetical protein
VCRLYINKQWERININTICVYLDAHNSTVILHLLCCKLLKCMLMCHHVKTVEEHKFNPFIVSPGIHVKHIALAVMMLELMFRK